MKQNLTAPSIRPAGKGRTQVAAAKLGVTEGTMRRGYCVDGHYCGLVPQKMPNRLLLWDLGEIDRLLAGEAIQPPDPAVLAAHFQRKAADASKVPAHLRAKAEKRLTSGEVAK